MHNGPQIRQSFSIFVFLLLLHPGNVVSQDSPGFPGVFPQERGSVLGWQRALEVYDRALETAKQGDPSFSTPSSGQPTIYPRYVQDQKDSERVSVPFLDDWLVRLFLEEEVVGRRNISGVTVFLPQVYAPSIDQLNDSSPLLWVGSFSEGLFALQSGSISSLIASSIDTLDFFKGLEKDNKPYPSLIIRAVAGPFRIQLAGSADSAYDLGLVNHYLRLAPLNDGIKIEVPTGLTWEEPAGNS